MKMMSLSPTHTTQTAAQTLQLSPKLSSRTSPLLRSSHLFSDRHGGVSTGAFAGLNLDDRSDDPALVSENRRRLCRALGFEPSQLARLNQVHGTEIITVSQAGVWTGDALVSSTKGLLLAIGTADCYPILLEDPEVGVIGAVHAGWKGTLGRLVQATVQAMTTLGARTEHIRAAVGVGICGECYAVGDDVARQFEAAGLAKALISPDHTQSQIHLDLQQANRQILEETGVQQQHIWQAKGCSTEPDFYSFRRDKGTTGRMWAVIGLLP